MIDKNTKQWLYASTSTPVQVAEFNENDLKSVLDKFFDKNENIIFLGGFNINLLHF